MERLIKRVGRLTLAAVLLVPSAGIATAQSVAIPIAPQGPTAPEAAQPIPPAKPKAEPTAIPPTAPEPKKPEAAPPAATTGLPVIGEGVGSSPGPSAPLELPSLGQPLPMTTSPMPVQDPNLSSKPSPFQVLPDAPAASNTPNFYDGNRPIQDMSALLAGRFANTKYKWYGFVRADGIYDFRPMGTTDAFVTSSIPIPQGRGQNFVITPRYSRIGFDTETPIESMDWTLKTRIEMDFFNGFSSGGFGSFPIRLRFAWADFGPFLIGQAASLFMDYDVFPNVLDYEGPGGMVLMRQPVAAVHFPVGEKFKVSLGVEQPYSDIQWLEGGAWVRSPGNGIITTAGVGRNVQDVPDFTANVRYEGDYGHAQVAGIARKLTFQPATGDGALDEIGYGINVTGTFHPWAALTGTPKSGDCATHWSKSRLMGQFAAGRGINRYIQDVNGLGLDATFDPVNGFRALEAYGWFMAYEQWWAKNWASVFTYGENWTELTDTLPGNTYQQADYVSANIIWLPIERMGVGLEYLYGFRKNKDGGRGENSRIQMAFQYRF